MEEENAQRTPSALLTSPTLRSSVQSLSALSHEHGGAGQPSKSLRRLPSINRAALRSIRVFLSLFFVSSFSFFYLCGVPPTVKNVVLVSAGVAAVAALVNRCRVMRLRPRKSESVRWFIGEDVVEGPIAGGVGGKSKAMGAAAAGEGVVVYGNGDAYEGEFRHGRCNGSGVYRFFGKGKYEGDWVDGRYDGHGVESWARGSRYRGQFRQGMRHGFGVYRFYNGDAYAGEWVGGQSHGRGMQSCSDGSCYFGDFKCGVKHGIGRYHFRNGDSYTGEYFGDKIHGFGVYSFANGHCYEGSWHEGRRQGFGTYTFRSGETRSGDWDCGVLKTTLPFSNLSVQRSIEAAMKASENASLLPMVEEEVNKAVAAANKAANAARVAAIRAVRNQMGGEFCDAYV